MNYEQRLKILVEHGQTLDTFSPGQDSCALQLSSEKQFAWKKLLGSILSAESAEGNVMKPVIQAFHFDPLIENYVTGHSEDEAKHARWIKNYLLQSFHFEKKQDTLGSKIIYGKTLPWVSAQISAKNPILILIGFLLPIFAFLPLLVYREKK